MWRGRKCAFYCIKHIVCYYLGLKKKALRYGNNLWWVDNIKYDSGNIFI